MLRRRCADPGLSDLQVAARSFMPQSHMQKMVQIVTVKATASSGSVREAPILPLPWNWENLRLFV